ncbi:E3 ubiquitin-protein ligase rnf213-alpha-like, partial [Lingula anatina]|uniref:E3 ubiquitin-protein ligase rnf213-alpha-like n=1 Tax=Lingula anatina TaxID=7574 RepID=A0A1S3I1M4_LINAN
MPQDEKGDKAESLSSSLFEGLFLLPEKNGKCESFQKLVEVHFPQEKQKVLIKGLEGLIKQFAGGNVKNPKWLLAIPLYHFLCGHSKPFARVDINEKHNHDSGKWWGIENIKKAVESFKKAMEYSRQGTSMMDRLVPLFKMDKLLPRTFMCTISFKDLKEVICSKSIPPEVSMAVLYYYIHVQSHEWPYLFNSDFKTLVSAVDAIKELIENQLAPSSQGSDHIEEVCGDAREISMVAHDFFEACSLKMDRELWRFVCSAVDVFVTASRVHHTFLVKSFVGAEKEREFQVESDRIAATFSSALECLNAWLYHCLPPVMGNLGTWSCVDELNIWSKLLSLEWPTDCTAKEWLRRELERKIDSIRLGKAKIDLFCSTDSKEYHHVVKECLSKAAFKAIET